MTMNIDTLVRATRPAPDEVDADFSRIDHQRLLDRAVTGTGSTPIAATQPRHRRIGVAAGLAALLLVGGAVTAGLQRSIHWPAAPSPVTASSTPNRGSAVLALSMVSANASRQPDPVIAADQYLHVKFVETQTGESAGQTTHDTYVAPDGWTWRHDTGDHDTWTLYDADGDGATSLPSDPEALEAVLRSGSGNNSGDERVWKGIDEILMTNAAPPKQRAAAIQVLQNLAQHPHSPETGKEGDATPRVTVRWVWVDGGREGLEATFTDAATRPGAQMTITLDEQGNLVSTKQTLPNGGTFASNYPVRELVPTLPADFVRQLGTQKKPVQK